MNEDEADDLFASVKLQLDEVVATPVRRDRAVKAAVVLRTLEQALYSAEKVDQNDEADEDDMLLGDVV